MKGLLDERLVRESIFWRINDYKKDLKLYKKNSEMALKIQGQIIALESFLSSLDAGCFEPVGDK